MLTFPQLRDSAVIQLPFTWRQRTRIVAQETPGGAVYRWPDTGYARREWQCLLRGLTDSERVAVQQLFDSVKGRYGKFTYLDPFGNLLAQSDNYAAAVWLKDAGLVLTSGLPDAFGTLQATRVSNPTGTARSMRQGVPAPAAFGFTLSVWIRAQTSAVASLELGGSVDLLRKDILCGPAWERVSMTGTSSSQEEQTLAGVSLPSGSEVEVCGWQLEPTLQAGTYQRTTAATGVFSNCRFLQDELRWTSEGPNNHSVKIMIAGR